MHVFPLFLSSPQPYLCIVSCLKEHGAAWALECLLDPVVPGITWAYPQYAWGPPPKGCAPGGARDHVVLIEFRSNTCGACSTLLTTFISKLIVFLLPFIFFYLQKQKHHYFFPFLFKSLLPFLLFGDLFSFQYSLVYVLTFAVWAIPSCAQDCS